MFTLQSTLYTAATVLFLFSAGLVRGRSADTTRVTWLTWFLVIEAGNFLAELLMAHPLMPLKGLWLGLRLGGALLIAPCLWLAVAEIKEGLRPTLERVGSKHLLAIATGWLLLVPLLEDSHLGLDYYNPHAPTSWLHSRLIHAGMLGCLGIFAVQAPLFLGRCRRLLFSAPQAEPASRWLHALLPLVATTWLMGLLRIVQCAARAPQELNLVYALAEVTVAVGAVFLLLRRQTVAVAPSAVPRPEPAPEPERLAPPELSASEVTETVAPVVAVARKYAKSRLTAVIRTRIRRKIERAMIAERLYRESGLTLGALCAALKENSHYVSQVLNEDFGATFYQLVNRYRIEEARQLLLEDAERTVLEIALAVGFNSKSTFNAAFREITGTTPSAYRVAKSGRGQTESDDSDVPSSDPTGMDEAEGQTR